MNSGQDSSWYSGDFSMSDFFKDSPWLAIPRERRGEILVKPLRPRWGLLGGTSKQDAAPKSKLAALAAARRGKENQKIPDGRSAATSVALLDKLGKAPQDAKANRGPALSAPMPQSEVDKQRAAVSAKKYPKRKPKDTAAFPVEQPLDASSTIASSSSNASTEEHPELTAAASPSNFARSMFGSIAEAEEPLIHALDHIAVRVFVNPTEFDFAGPSPDDVVLGAQNPKSQNPKLAKHKQPPTNGNTSFNGVTEGVKDVAIEEQRVKGKNLDVVAEFKKSKPKKVANFVVIGLSVYEAYI